MTFSRESPLKMERFSEAAGSGLTPPSLVLKALRKPARSSSRQVRYRIRAVPSAVLTVFSRSSNPEDSISRSECSVIARMVMVEGGGGKGRRGKGGKGRRGE